MEKTSSSPLHYGLRKSFLLTGDKAMYSASIELLKEDARDTTEMAQVLACFEREKEGDKDDSDAH